MPLKKVTKETKPSFLLYIFIIFHCEFLKTELDDGLSLESE